MKIALSALLVLLAVSGAAQAVEVYVVEAKGVDLAPGKVLDGAKPLSLAVGQKLVLVTNDGRTIKLKGPFDAAPAPEGQIAQADMAKSLKGLMVAQAADTSSAGVVRSAGAVVRPVPPEPWLVDIRHGGDSCVAEGTDAILWRGRESLTEAEIEISPADRSWRARSPWPGGSDRLAMPPSLPLHDGKSYAVVLGKTTAVVTIHTVPASLGSDAARVAWLLQLGCDTQAQALVNGAP